MCQKLQHQYMCHMFSFCGITGMLILYVYREKDREKNGDSNKKVHRDLRDTAKKQKRKKLQVNSMERKLYTELGVPLFYFCKKGSGY